MKGASATLHRRSRGSLPGRLVTVIGLAFVTVELTVLGVFTFFYGADLIEDRQEHLVHTASGLHEHVRAALLRPAEEGSLDERLDAALRGPADAAREEAGAPSPYVPPAGAPVEVLVFASGRAQHFTRTGQLVPLDDRRAEARWGRDGRPPEAQAFLRGEQLVPRMEVYRDRIVRVEPLPLGGTELSGGQRPAAVLYLETSLTDLHQQVATHALVAFGTGAVALLFTAVVTMSTLRRSLLLPLARIIRADNAAREGDEARAVVDEGDIPDDEVGAIMRSRNHLFRAMTRAQRDLDEKNTELERQREELRRWGRELERLVQEKTAALLSAREHIYRAEKLAAVGRLAANVAHEINNPLASIAGYAEEARDALEDDPDLQDVVASLRTIEEQAFRCKDILKRLLGLARADDAIRFAPVSLGRLLRETTALAEPAARKRKVALRIELPEDADGPQVESHASSLQQVVLNLLENAADAAVQGDGAPWVAVSIQEREREVALVVRDSGRGVDPDLRERVFDPFYTTKPIGRGTGLGLAICQSLLERLGGRITLESAPGEGAAFAVWVPRDAPPAPPSASSSSLRTPERLALDAPAARPGPVADGSSLVEAQLRRRGSTEGLPD